MEYKIGRAIVRVTGSADQEKLKQATAVFIRNIERKGYKQSKTERNQPENSAS